ncbi:adenine-specific methyltransferase [Photobacterium aphoticum]|uniref:Adenine-specific methyltransferase n=1 Tax=Photobacterium aphoticum TaxID=754436 RepID=A0A090RKC2_9GAMM|nr:adenine-specific methyltransferase [Photobacterium aphoticum]
MAECLRVLKPGGYLLAFAGTRTQHRMATNIEDSGFEIKDMIAWVYGSGWPKSMDISKAIDKRLGATREVIGENPNAKGRKSNKSQIAGTGGTYGANDEKRISTLTKPATVEAEQWEGWGTALKPALEPITVARKPHKGTIAANILTHGVGGINIEKCRVEAESEYLSLNVKQGGKTPSGGLMSELGTARNDNFTPASGRFPANLIHDGSDEVIRLFPANAGAAAKVKGNEPSSVHGNIYGAMARDEGKFYGDKGSAARFFYCAKACRSDRTNNGTVSNKHVTVKPTDLMRYLCRLVTLLVASS